MTSNDWRNDPSPAGLASLRTYDVSARHADRLRSQCIVLMQAQTRPNAPAGLAIRAPFRRNVALVLGGAWCLAYVIDIIRRAAAIYG